MMPTLPSSPNEPARPQPSPEQMDASLAEAESLIQQLRARTVSLNMAVRHRDKTIEELRADLASLAERVDALAAEDAVTDGFPDDTGDDAGQGDDPES